MNPEHYAAEIITDLGITALPIDPFEIAMGFDIAVAEEDADNFEGCLLRSGSSARIIINKNIESAGRKRFTLAHELGHYSIPTHSGNYECLAKNLNPFSKNLPQETEANKFASELLLPVSLLKPLVHQFKPDFDDLADLAEYCGTSLTATAIKYVSLTDDCCALVASANSIVEWSAKSSPFHFFIEKGAPIAKGTLTESYRHTAVPQISCSQKTAASLWIDGDRVKREFELVESCIPVHRYGYVLTLLWLLDFSDGEEEEDQEHRYEESSWKWREPED